ncbi:MAG TPA: 4-(cytidine 5'-diphospho)-2-C-methyl-D-erythritol kinase, partial [Nitrospiria bacterium]|nr:4-(cytidine 5'-diphospho)-2-C-methyl-D-erythritol kinase [Nitrospiria bacterium]
QSIMQMVDLCDILTFEKRRSGIALASNSKDIPLDSDNIVFRAAELLKDKGKISEGISIYIKKNIPVSAGLGGGSSNAAATLMTLNRLWGLGYGMNELSLIGGRLGSDVPFFLGGVASFVEGRGEIVHPIRPDRNRWLVLVNPGIKVSTSWSYNRIDVVRGPRETKTNWLTKTGKDNKLQKFNGLKLDLIEFSSLMQNDLEEITARQNRVIQEIRDDLKSLDAKGVVMSGSGATVFGIFANKEEARTAANKLINKRPWKVWVVKTLSKSPIMPAL